MIGKGCCSRIKGVSTCSEMMAEFIDVGESHWHQTASQDIHHFGGGGVMGGICGQRTTRLIIIRVNLTGQRYRDEVLRPVVAILASTA